MFFFVTWGSRGREDMLGVVADYCPSCRRVRRHSVVRYSRVSHVYFIPVSDSHLGVGRQCYRCDNVWKCNPRHYDCILDEADALQTSVGRLLEITNPRLLQELEESGQDERLVRPGRPRALERIAENAPKARVDEDPEVKVALERLAAYADFDRKAVQLKIAYRDWPRMSAEERQDHTEAVERYISDQKRLAQLSEIAGQIAAKMPRHSCIFVLALLLAAGAISAPWLMPFAWPPIAVVGYSVGVAGLASILASFVIARRNRHWVRESFVPALEQSGQDPGAVHNYLSRLNPRDRSIDPSLRELASRQSVLGAVLKEQGKLDDYLARLEK